MSQYRFVSRDLFYLDIATRIASQSNDPSTKVGAVIVSEDGDIVGTGYNRFAKGVRELPERMTDRETKYKMMSHAEVNAIKVAGARARGGTIYVVPSFTIPCLCHSCANACAEAGIKFAVGYVPGPEAVERAARWADSLAVAKTICDEAGIGYYGVPQ